MAEEKIKNRFYGMLGLAAKAGKVKSGEFSSEQSIKAHKARLCIIAADASDNTRKHFCDMCSYRDIPIYIAQTDKTALGHIIGRGPRTSVVIEDEGFAVSMIGLIDGGNVSGK